MQCYPKSITTTLSRIFSCTMLSGASWTTLYKVLPVQCCPKSVKTTLNKIFFLLNVAWTLFDNIKQSFWWWWWWIVLVVWLTDERHLALFPAGTIVRDPHHRESPTRREQDLNLRRTLVEWMRLSWMKLCSSENHYTTASQSVEQCFTCAMLPLG